MTGTAVHTANLRFQLDDSASTVLEALRPEADEGPEGTQTELLLDGDVLVAHVTADDLSGLRAAIHSVTRLLDAAVRTLN